VAGTLYLFYDAPHTYQRHLGTDDIDALLGASHHYVVTRGPSVRVTEAWPVSSRVVAMGLRWGDHERHVAIEFEDRCDPSVTTLGDGIYWLITSGRGQLLLHGSAWAFAAFMDQDDPTLSQHQVLYIGKAYGSKGTATRNASARLAAHSTLQRIYEDHLGMPFDVFVTPLLEEQGFWTNDDFIDDDEPGPSGDWMEFNYGSDAERWRVALAEEALIAYFKPEYNQILTEWSGKTVASRIMRRTGLRVLKVTVTAWLGLASFYSTHRPEASRAHHVRWVVDQAESSQAEYSPHGLFEPMDHRVFTAHLAAVEGSGRVFHVFGPALPKRSPWDAAFPAEDQLSADENVTSAHMFNPERPPSTRQSTNPPVPESPQKRWRRAIRWRFGRAD
jgi:hypothetical protein